MKLDNNSLFDELTRITKLHAYAVTGDERHLKDPIPALTVAANALHDAADQLKRDNDFAEMPKQKFCRDHGCPCKDRCEGECYAKTEGL